MRAEQPPDLLGDSREQLFQGRTGRLEDERGDVLPTNGQPDTYGQDAGPARGGDNVVLTAVYLLRAGGKASSGKVRPWA
jgi:hypothetical protein